MNLRPWVTKGDIQFELCRRKRNRLDYDLAGIATDGEVSELIEKVLDFRGRLKKS